MISLTAPEMCGPLVALAMFHALLTFAPGWIRLGGQQKGLADGSALPTCRCDSPLAPFARPSFWADSGPVQPDVPTDGTGPLVSMVAATCAPAETKFVFRNKLEREDGEPPPVPQLTSARGRPVIVTGRRRTAGNST